MKRTAIVLLAVMLAGTMLMAQTPAATQQTAPAAGQQTGQQQPPAAQQPKKGGPPMAKTKEEFDAYQKVAQQMQGGQIPDGDPSQACAAKEDRPAGLHGCAPDVHRVASNRIGAASSQISGHHGERSGLRRLLIVADDGPGQHSSTCDQWA